MTYMGLKMYGIPRCMGPTSLNSRPLLSFNVLEHVLRGYEFGQRQGSHDDATLSQSLLQSLPGSIVTNDDTCV